MTRTTRWIAIAVLALGACAKKKADEAPPPAPAEPAPAPASSLPPLDATNIVTIAVGSKDHTTLVAALKAADYVTAAAASGPLTVFAPTDAAFGKLPAGTVESLVKPENTGKLKEILKYHVTTATYDPEKFTDGQEIGMANGAKVTMHVKDGKIMVNDANVIASIRASNGIIHVVDGVLLPPPPAP